MKIVSFRVQEYTTNAICKLNPSDLINAGKSRYKELIKSVVPLCSMSQSQSSSHHCPHCNSFDIQRLSSIYEQSISTFQISGYSFKGGLFGGSGRQITQLGKRVAPPIRQSPGVRWMGIAGIACFASIVLHLLIGIVITSWFGVSPSVPARSNLGVKIIFHSMLLSFVVFLGWGFWKCGQSDEVYNRTVHTPAREKWHRSYYCHRCGQIFDPTEKKLSL